MPRLHQGRVLGFAGLAATAMHHRFEVDGRALSTWCVWDSLFLPGVLVSLTAGLLVGNVGWNGAISPNGRGHVLAFWEYAAFLVNSIVFILIGIQEAHQPLSFFSGASAIAIFLVLVGRALAVYPLCALFIATPLRVDASHQHVLVWGGLRGALALALALALPDDVAEHREIIVSAFAVVAFSIFVQGLTMPWLIRSLGLTAASGEAQPECHSD
jgi:monovalent cation:H+ antiporter, CPA1 family